jgi:succinylglutamate desuccinylase
MAGRKKLAVINSSLMKEIEFAKEYMTQREKELEESREDVFHKFEAGKESLLKEHCAIKNTMENEFKVERETQQMQLKALMERIEVS